MSLPGKDVPEIGTTRENRARDFTCCHRWIERLRSNVYTHRHVFRHSRVKITHPGDFRFEKLHFETIGSLRTRVSSASSGDKWCSILIGWEVKWHKPIDTRSFPLPLPLRAVGFCVVLEHKSGNLYNFTSSLCSLNTLSRFHFRNRTSVLFRIFR